MSMGHYAAISQSHRQYCIKYSVFPLLGQPAATVVVHFFTFYSHLGLTSANNFEAALHECVGNNLHRYFVEIVPHSLHQVLAFTKSCRNIKCALVASTL